MSMEKMLQLPCPGINAVLHDTSGRNREKKISHSEGN
jgi:hypothetical protein